MKQHSFWLLPASFRRLLISDLRRRGAGAQRRLPRSLPSCAAGRPPVHPGTERSIFAILVRCIWPAPSGRFLWRPSIFKSPTIFQTCAQPGHDPDKNGPHSCGSILVTVFLLLRACRAGRPAIPLLLSTRPASATSSPPMAAGDPVLLPAICSCFFGPPEVLHILKPAGLWHGQARSARPFSKSPVFAYLGLASCDVAIRAGIGLCGVGPRTTCTTVGMSRADACPILSRHNGDARCRPGVKICLVDRQPCLGRARSRSRLRMLWADRLHLPCSRLWAASRRGLLATRALDRVGLCRNTLLRGRALPYVPVARPRVFRDLRGWDYCFPKMSGPTCTRDIGQLHLRMNLHRRHLVFFPASTFPLVRACHSRYGSTYSRCLCGGGTCVLARLVSFRARRAGSSNSTASRWPFIK